jgi:hypothetical protein
MAAGSNDERAAQRAKEEEQERQRLRAQEFLKKFDVERAACVVCGSNDWLVSSPFVLPELPESPQPVQGPVLPVVPVVCLTCGYTRMFNAVIVGALERAEESDTVESDEVDEGRSETGTARSPGRDHG